MTAEPVKQKTKAGLFLQNILKPIIRAAVKQIPVIGTPIAEIITNVTTPKGAVKKHSYLSIGVQILIAVCVVYAFWTKAITIQEVVDILKMFLPMPDSPAI